MRIRMNKIRRTSSFAASFFTICLLCGCGADASAVVPDEGPFWTMGREDIPCGPKQGSVEDGITGPEHGADGNKEGEDGFGQTDGAVTESEIDDNTVTITISAAGDVTLGNHQEQEYAYSFRQTYDQEGDAYFLQNVKDIFQADDMTIVNFEGVLTFSEEMQEKDYNMKGDPDYINILTEGCVEAVSFGNNHRLDFLAQGSSDTVAAFEDAGLAYAYDRITGIYEAKGIRIGIVSVNEVSQGAGVEKYLQEGIAQLRDEEDADLVIACCHWGVERENYPEDYQKELGRKCIDWGADLVLGSHPHVLQGVDIYDGKFIVYSLANFCFGGNRNPADKDTMIFSQTFTFEEGVKQQDMEAKVIPCSVSSVPNRNDFCPTPLTGEEYIRVLQKINEYSAPFGVAFGADGCYMEPEG